MNRWKCTVCGYIHEGDEPPEFCPVCDARKDEFELIEEAIVERRNDEVRTVIVVGNGAAGLEAARSVRSQLPDAEIHLYSREKYPFYSRLFLTPYLAGEKSREELFVFPENWYRENRIVQHLGEEVTEIIPQEREILTSDDVWRYDRLILCNGARAFRPHLVGEEKTGVFALRNLDDADAILNFLPRCQKAVVIGGGILGLEAAGAFARRGLQVDVLELGRTLMPRQLDERGAQLMTEILARKGISIHTHADAVEILGGDRVTGVRLRDGRTVSADLILLSVGIWPEVTLAEEAGLKVNRGIVVNDYLQTSDPFIFAAGDVAEHRGKIYGLWFTSSEQGRIAGQNAAGSENIYTGSVPSAILKVIDVQLTSLGQFVARHDDEEEIVGGDGDYRKLVVKDGLIIGAIVFGDNQLGAAIERLMKKKQLLDRNILSALRQGEWQELIGLSQRRS